MNLERLLYRQALPVLLGQAASAGVASLPRVWFDALAEVETRIDPLMQETNIRRAEARAIARRRI